MSFIPQAVVLGDSAEEVCESLLRKSYFPDQKQIPEELPSIFATNSFVPTVAQELKLTRKDPDRKGNGYDTVEYLLTRFNGVSRPLSLPHPKARAELVCEITDNWDNFSYIHTNICSQIKPQLHLDGRLVVMNYEGFDEKFKRQIDQTFGKRYRVHTDITNCYPSIYSHALPWALVGKDVAKKDKDHNKWFNKLDAKLRLGRRNETQGIAIGPATSNIVAEAILARVDESLSEKYSYTRYIDDYTCFCDSSQEAHEFIKDLREALKQYNLSINIKKTTIDELPVPPAEDWILALTAAMPKGVIEEEGVSISAPVRQSIFWIKRSVSIPRWRVVVLSNSLLYML